MKNKYLLITIMLAFVLSATCLVLSGCSRSTEYYDPEGTYSLKIPGSWIPSDTSLIGEINLHKEDESLYILCQRYPKENLPEITCLDEFVGMYKTTAMANMMLVAKLDSTEPVDPIEGFNVSDAELYVTDPYALDSIYGSGSGAQQEQAASDEAVADTPDANSEIPIDSADGTNAADQTSSDASVTAHNSAQTGDTSAASRDSSGTSDSALSAENDEAAETSGNTQGASTANTLETSPVPDVPTLKLCIIYAESGSAYYAYSITGSEASFDAYKKVLVKAFSTIKETNPVPLAATGSEEAAEGAADENAGGSGEAAEGTVDENAGESVE